MMSLSVARSVIGTWRYQNPLSASERLQFGNDRQIQAVRTMELYEEAVEHGGAECLSCHGSGVVECFNCGGEQDCEDCDGSGVDIESFAVKEHKLPSRDKRQMELQW